MCALVCTSQSCYASPSDDLMITLITILIITLWTANNRGVHLPAGPCICSNPLSQGGPFSSPPFQSSEHALLERKLTAIAENTLKPSHLYSLVANFGRCYVNVNSVLMLIVSMHQMLRRVENKRMHQMLRRVENKRVRCTVSKSDALACHSRCRLPGTGWSSQTFFEPAKYLLSYGRKINSKYG